MASASTDRKNNRSQEKSENKRTDIQKRNTRRLVIALLIAVFLVLVLFNLFSCTRDADVGDETIAANKKKVSEFQQIDVTAVEDAVDALDSDVSETEIKRIKYRRMFSSSIIIGDSLTEGLTVYRWLDSSNVLAAVGGSILYSDDKFSAAASAKPKYCFFAFGMNDMGNFSKDAARFKESYTAILKKFMEASPKTKVCVNSISTPTAEAQAGNSSIACYKEFNAAIKQMCQELKITFVDISDILPSHPDMYAGDGIHADPDYYPLWMDRMAEKAGLR